MELINSEEKQNSIDWDTIVNMMDDDLREQVNNDLAPCSEEQFLQRYLELSVYDLIIG